MEKSSNQFQLDAFNNSRETNLPHTTMTTGDNTGFHGSIYLPPLSKFDARAAKPSIWANGDIKENQPKKNDEKKDQESIPILVRHFMGYTTAHGMNRLSEAKGIIWKMFWSLVCLAASSMFVYQAVGLFNLYFSKPVGTNVKFTFEKQVAFPAVTICNMNMIRSHAVPDILKQEIAKTYTEYNASEDLGKIVRRTRRDVNDTSSGTYSSYSSTMAPTTQQSVTTFSQTTSKPTSDGASFTTQAYQTASLHNPTTTSPDPITFHTTASNNPTGSYNPTTAGSYNPTTAGSYNPTVGSYNPTTYYNSYNDPNNYYNNYYYNDNDDYYNSGYHDGYYVRYYDRELLPTADEVDRDTLFLERFATYVTRVPEKQLRKSGHQFEDLITNCTWRGLNCKTGNYSNWWYQTWNYKYGNCYTFNGGRDQNNKRLRVLSTSKPGPSQGLLLHVNIDQTSYLGSVTAEAGVRVVLHDQGVMPFPFEEGFSVSPGMSSSVGIQKTVITRVDRFGNNSCFHINELDKKNIYRVHNNITKYTKQTCQNSCLGKTQFEECGCSEYIYPSGHPACDAFNETTRKCLTEVHIKYNNDRLPCYQECRQPCSEEVIEKTISGSQWPSTNYEVNKKRFDKSFSGNNALVLNIFFKELNYHRIEETFTYDVINLLADIGGQLGLWIGVSVITCAELLELILLMVVHLVRKLQRNARPEIVVLP